MAYKKRIAGITIELDGDTSKLVKSLDQVSRKVEGVGKKIEGVGKTLTTHLTVPIVTAAGVCVTKFAEVDKTMTLTNQTMGNTAEQADILNKAMQDAAANSVFGMDDAAQASLNFARAGLKAEEAANALAPAMNLAAGEGGDLDTVSAGLVATLNGFGDAFENAEHYADVFANACNNSALDVNSLSDSMSIAAPIFNAAGYSVQDAALYMGVMANAGIDAGEAANSLKTGLARLISPAKDGAVWMERLGINVTNADGSMKDTVTIQKELHDSFATLSESEQITAASAIFGKMQMAKWLALINTAPSDVEKLNEALEQEGTTTDMANAMMSGFGGSIEKLKSTLDVLMTTLGQLAAQYLTPVIEKLQAWLDAFNALDDETKDHIIKIAAIVAAVGPALIIIGKIVTGIGSIISVVSGLVSAIGAISAAIGVASAPVLGIIAVIAAVIAIGVLLYKNWDTIKEKAQELWQNLTEKFELIKLIVTQTWEWIKTSTTEAWDNIKNKVANSDIGQAASKVWDAMKKTATDSFSAIKKAYDEHGGGLKGAVAATMEGIKQYYLAGYNFINNLTGGKLDAIKDKVTSTFNTIKEKVKSAIDFIKGIFNFNWELPKIKMPHFNVSWTDYGMISLPSVHVDWYKKAMNQAYMLNGATIFGQSGGHLLGGGESGSEMIIGTNRLMSMIAQAKGGQTTINNQFVINGADRDPQALAQEISYYLDMELQRTQGAFA